MPKLKTDAELIDTFATGIEEKHYTSVVMQSARFVIFKVAGHMAWSCVGCPFEYVKTQYVLIRKGDWWMSEEKRQWQGRVSKAILTEALRQSELKKEIYNG